MRIHILGIGGGVLGLVALILPWLTVTAEGTSASAAAFDMFSLLALSGPTFSVVPGLGIAILLLVVAAVLVLVGSIVAIFHPGGGVPLLVAGILGLLGAIWLKQSLEALPGITVDLRIGLAIPLVAGGLALTGFGAEAGVLWPRGPPVPVSPPPWPAYSPFPPGAPKPVPYSPRAAPPPTPPPIRSQPTSASPPAEPAAGEHSGWVSEIDSEIRGLERALGEERESLSLVAIDFENGLIDDPTYDARSRDASERIEALERRLETKRLERDRFDLPPPPD